MGEERIIFDYHYEEEADRYSFFRIPKALYTEERFSKLSDGAKVLYGQLLDRMSLSRKNGWLDPEGRVFIRCSIENIKEMMNCSNDKAVKMLKELDGETGIGLIEKKKQGQGKMTIIYVKSFIILKNRSYDISGERGVVLNSEDLQVHRNGLSEYVESEEQHIRVLEDRKPEFREAAYQYSDKRNISIPETRIQGFRKPEYKDSENQNIGIPKTGIQEFRKPEYRNSENQNTKIPKYGIPEFRKPDANNTDINNTNIIKHHHQIKSDISQLKRQIEYENLILKFDQHEVDQIVETIIWLLTREDEDNLFPSLQKTIREIKARYLKLDRSKIESVLIMLESNPNQIFDKRSYLIKVLFNAEPLREHVKKQSRIENRFSNFPQHKYDFTALEKELLDNC